MSTSSICVITNSWPRISTTFVAQELVGLERCGFNLSLFTRKRGDTMRHALHDELRAPLSRLPATPLHAPIRFLRAWRKARRLPGYRAALALFRKDRHWGSPLKQYIRFWNAIVTAAEMPEETRGIYVHFITAPGTIGRYAAVMRDLPIMGSAHARDIWMMSDREKKGFDVLIDALSRLPAGLHWRWDHIGEGVILDKLKSQAAALGIDKFITWHGAQRQDAVIAAYRDHDLFIFPAREAADGDKDGLPNVLMEAQTQALCCLATRFTAIPELIEDGVTGLLVPPADSDALVEAIVRLAQNPGLRDRLGVAGCRRVRAHFQAEKGIEEIAGMLRREIA
jgi:glycosyltransferase involved in cell wall biosynthesis